MVIIGADHAGFELKVKILDYFKKSGIECVDVTDCPLDINDDYVDVVEKLADKVLESSENFGIAICGTGVGISIACNKIKGIRAGICYNDDVAKMIKEDNNCNIICFGGRQEKDINSVLNRINIFMNASFLGGRHERRVGKIADLEERFGDKK